MKRPLVIFIFFLVSVTLPLPLRVNGQNIVVHELFLKTINYKLDLRVDFEKEKLFGNCELTVLNSSEHPIDHIPLVLYRLLSVKSVKDEQGFDLPFSQRVVSFEDWEPLQVNFIQVPLQQEIQKGERRTINIQYEGFLLGYTEVGMLYVKDHIDENFTILRPDCYAYPFVGYPSWKVNRAAGFQKFDYLVNVTVPESLTVANGGRLMKRTVEENRVTYSYCNIKPAWRIDIAIASYCIFENNKIKIFFFSEDSVGALRAIEIMNDSLDLFSQWFGPLHDYQGFCIIEIPEGWGSQADVTSIIQTAAAFKNPEQIYQLYHEVSHQWNVKLLDPAPSRFESEGLAMFLQYLVQEQLGNKRDAVKNAAERYCESFRKACKNNPKCKDVAVIDYGKENLTDLSYTKGMVLFYILYELTGDDQFKEIIGSFYRKYNTTGATSEDFVEHFKLLAKVDLTQFFDEWVYGIKSSEYIIKGVPVEDMVRIYKK